MSANDSLPKDTPDTPTFDEEELEEVPMDNVPMVAVEPARSALSAVPIVTEPPVVPDSDDTHGHETSEDETNDNEEGEEEGNIPSESAPTDDSKKGGPKKKKRRNLMLLAAVLIVVIIVAVVVPVVVTRKNGSEDEQSSSSSTPPSAPNESTPAANETGSSDSTMEGGIDLPELQKAWWYWALCPDTYTFSQRECASQNDVPDGWYFLAGSGEDYIGQIVERWCEGIPNNKSILIPVVAGHGQVPDDAEAIQGVMDDSLENGNNYGLVDGEEQSIQHAITDTYAFTTPTGCEVLELEGLDTMARGLWLIIPPLSSGEHVVEIHGELPMLEFSTEVVHYLSVE